MYKLHRIFDCRAVDLLTGEKEHVEPEQLPMCTRCGRRHAKVWQFRDEAGTVVTVGPACGRKLVAGSPSLFNFTDDDVKRAKADEKAKREARANAKVAEKASELVACVQLPDTPPPVEAYYDPRFQTWGFHLACLSTDRPAWVRIQTAGTANRPRFDPVNDTKWLLHSYAEIVVHKLAAEQQLLKMGYGLRIMEAAEVLVRARIAHWTQALAKAMEASLSHLLQSDPTNPPKPEA